jgi:ABC-type Na+ transport system ATPase subunit NatA
MKPQELADELTKMFVGEEYDRLVHEIPDLLRQQQAEIEALKAKLQLHEAMDNQCASLMQQFRKAQE